MKLTTRGHDSDHRHRPMLMRASERVCINVLYMCVCVFMCLCLCMCLVVTPAAASRAGPSLSEATCQTRNVLGLQAHPAVKQD